MLSNDFVFRPRVERLDGAPALHLALSRLRGREQPVLLDSAAGRPARFSLLAFDPLPIAPPQRLEGLRELCGRLRPVPGDPVPGCFHGGFLGALAYELGAAAEAGLRLPADPWGMPLVVGGLYTDFLVRDEQRGHTWLVLGEEPGDARASVAVRRAEILAALRGEAPARPELRPLGPLIACVSESEHAERIERTRQLIAEGEIYQANLARRFTRSLRGDPVDLYARLRSLHPAPYMGFLRWRKGALLSGSPELLLELTRRDGRSLARTRPIKGTTGRGASPAQDEARMRALRESEKDLAELAMIVDLERNDLGRVALPGGVRVTGFPRLESYANVHHLMADVEARLAPGVDAVSLLRSLFPGGSITGAPKLRSMEVIAALEGEGRGFSFGALGFVDTRGRALFNLLIRTLIWRPRRAAGPWDGAVTYRVGGGITWGSEPGAELAECRIKGELLARALESPGAPARRSGDISVSC